MNAYAEFVAPHKLKLTNKKGEVSEVSAKDIIIAVGGRPAYPNVPGNNNFLWSTNRFATKKCANFTNKFHWLAGAKEFCITSDDLFSLSNPPGKTLIVGASYIALECGGFLKGLGYDVTIMVSHQRTWEKHKYVNPLRG